MTPVEEMILTELSALREEVGQVSAVVRGWRGQLVKQAGLVAIAVVTALAHACAPTEAGTDAGAHGTCGATSAEGGAPP